MTDETPQESAVSKTKPPDREFYVVTTGSRMHWVAFEEDQSIFAWFPSLGKFVEHRALAIDFYFKYDMVWISLTIHEAFRLADEGEVGKIGDTDYLRQDLLARRTQSAETRSRDEVFAPIWAGLSNQEEI
jgi:hypothetical protein